MFGDVRGVSSDGRDPIEAREKAIRKGRGKLKPLNATIDPEWVLSLHDTQCVRKDGTIIVKRMEYKVGSYPGKEVTICLIPEVKFMILGAILVL